MKSIFRVLLLAAAVTIPAAYGQYSTPVREVEKPEKRPVTISFDCPTATTCSSVIAPTIPAGSRLVIEYVSAFIGANAVGTGSRTLMIQSNGLNHYMASSDILPSGQTVISRSVKLYFDTIPAVTILGGSVGTTVDITLSGYLATK